MFLFCTVSWCYPSGPPPYRRATLLPLVRMMDNPNSKQSKAAQKYSHPIIHLMRYEPNQVHGLFALLDWAEIPNNAQAIEIGSYTGESATLMLTHKPQMTLTCVDTWQWPLSEHYFDLRARPWGLIKHKADSIDAASRYNRDSFHLIYIDASHEYADVKRDIKAWLPKVKPGGVIAGHDYSRGWPGVRKAVDEIFGQPHATFIDSSWAVRKE